MSALSKLVEVVAAGIGGLVGPWQSRRQAKAASANIETIAGALQQVQHLPLNIEFKDQHVQIVKQSDSFCAELGAVPTASLGERALARLTLQEQKRHLNLEHIVSEAAEELADDEDVSADPLDADWIARFFRIAEDISTEQMQSLWGRILAGEVKQPGSFALRTLDVLRIITKDAAEVFARFAEHRTGFDDTSSVIVIDSGNHWGFIERVLGITYGESLLLRELDLLVASDQLGITMTLIPDKKRLVYLGDRGLLLTSERDEEIQLPELAVVSFTTAGHQLAQLIPPKPNQEYIRKVASLLKCDGVFFETCVPGAKRSDGGVHLSQRQPLAV